MSTKNAVRRYWDAHPISTDSVSFERGSRELFDAIYERWQHKGTSRLSDFLASCEGRKVLEVGCGIAIDGCYLSEHGVDYQAVDLSFESLRLADQHFSQHNLRRRFTNADATQLPFHDDTFEFVYSIGVLHHVPDTPAACREVARVLRPGGRLRIMLYGRNSYHYYLVVGIVYPLIWLLMRLPLGHALARKGPKKFRNMFDICIQNGLSKKRLLDISTDTSSAGDDNFNPHSSFYSAIEIKELFKDFENLDIWKTDLRYFPIPWFRPFFERHLGFFMHMTARKTDLKNEQNCETSTALDK